jgi:hypothetical protein
MVAERRLFALLPYDVPHKLQHLLLRLLWLDRRPIDLLSKQPEAFRIPRGLLLSEVLRDSARLPL